MKDIEEMTPYEYRLRMKASALTKLDEEERVHKQAFLNMAVEATDKQGKKAKFDKYEKFFNYDKIYKEMFGDKEKIAETEHQVTRRKLLLEANKEGG